MMLSTSFLFVLLGLCRSVIANPALLPPSRVERAADLSGPVNAVPVPELMRLEERVRCVEAASDRADVGKY